MTNHSDPLEVQVEKSLEDIINIMKTLTPKQQYTVVNMLVLSVLNSRESELKILEDSLKREKEQFQEFVKTIAVTGNRA